MKTLLLACLILLSAGCAIFGPQVSHEERVKCIQTLPVYRAEPKRPYSVVKIVTGENDFALKYEACWGGLEAADALVMMENATEMRVVDDGNIFVTPTTRATALLQAKVVVFTGR
jgi:hypothetical protein